MRSLREKTWPPPASKGGEGGLSSLYLTVWM